jgi:GNAT superfamily N-acetyltransferase
MAAPVTIRPARLADRIALLSLWQAFIDEQSAFDPRFARADDAGERWHNDFPHWLGDAGMTFLVAEAAASLVGFVFAQRWWPPPIYAGPEEVYLNELYVVPAARGHGVGTRLVAAVQDWAAAVGAARLRLGVLAHNAPGQAFWARQQAEALYTILVLPVPEAPPTPPRARLGF